MPSTNEANVFLATSRSDVSLALRHDLRATIIIAIRFVSVCQQVKFPTRQSTRLYLAKCTFKEELTNSLLTLADEKRTIRI